MYVFMYKIYIHKSCMYYMYVHKYMYVLCIIYTIYACIIYYFHINIYMHICVCGGQPQQQGNLTQRSVVPVPHT